MSYEGQALADFVGAARDGVKVAGEKMADRGGEVMTDRVKENTPVSDHDLDPRLQDFTHLRDEIFQKQTVYTAAVWESGSYTEVDYAPYVEEGTGLWGPEHREYIIRPRDPNGVLAFFSRNFSPEGVLVQGSAGRGALVFAKFVMHPGSPGAGMFKIGAAITQHELPTIGRDGIRAWEEYISSHYVA